MDFVYRYRRSPRRTAYSPDISRTWDELPGRPGVGPGEPALHDGIKLICTLFRTLYQFFWFNKQTTFCWKAQHIPGVFSHESLFCFTAFN